MKESNALIQASSPYLLQHAYNPVQWHEWGADALEKARLENKLLIVSIGYSACHWCHVMERESFEDHEVAEVMNQHFVCIKVDREERPDIDQVYMLALQLMNGQGGWPLNMICLPDQRPIYGGTYFRKADWINILSHLAALWREEPEKAMAYGERLREGLQQAEKTGRAAATEGFYAGQVRAIVEPWKRHFDMLEGGYNRAPKFPMPNNWLFLLRYGHLMADRGVTAAVLQTLEKMAFGGIYDQLGGGFARYSVDGHWHVPHFEKMLYDNAQLLSLYTEAYVYRPQSLYQEVVQATVAWLEREMSAPEGLFYSALDADSEGVEGKFYTWTAEEFRAVAGEHAPLLAAYFDVTSDGNWTEEAVNILRRKEEEAAFALAHQLEPAEWHRILSEAKTRLLNHRQQRLRPGLDDKCLTAWNAMTIKALCEAGQVFDQPEWIDRAEKAMHFLLTHLRDQTGQLYRNYKNGKASIPAFLDDYAFLIEALIVLYEYRFEEKWLLEARRLSDQVLAQFADTDSELLFYTAAHGENLIVRKQEIMDDVIPASNSVMAQNLQKLGLFFDDAAYSQKAAAMLAAVLPRIAKYGSVYSNWCIQLLQEVEGIYEIAISGEEPGAKRRDFSRLYLPNKIMLGGAASTLPLLAGKQSADVRIYVCHQKTCQLPVSTLEAALPYLHSSLRKE